MATERLDEARRGDLKGVRLVRVIIDGCLLLLGAMEGTLRLMMV